MRDFRIHQIILNEIGAFKHLNLTLKSKHNPDKADVHILTGENGTGKSTILEAISAVGSPNKLSSKAHTNTVEKIYFDIRFSSFIQDEKISNEEIFSLETSMSEFRGGKWLRNQNPKDTIFQYFQKWTKYQYSKFDFAIFAYSGYRKLDRNDISSIQEITENPLQNSLDLTNSINPQIILQWIANTKTKEALTFTSGKKELSNRYKNSIAQIENIINDITGWKIKFNLADSPLKVQVTIDGIDLDFSNLPDGLKSIISWVTDLLMRLERLPWNNDESIFDRNFILLLDEIEVHLHPAWQRKVLPIIQNLFKNAQLIVSTHSPFVANSVDDAWIYKLKKVGQYSVLDGEPILSEDAKSYRTVLEEVFGIAQQFGDEIENDLQEFYSLKHDIIKGIKNIDDKIFQDLCSELSIQSVELENIIGMELKQIKNVTKKVEKDEKV